MSMFGSSDMSLGISVILRDQFSAQSQRVNQSMRQMNATAQQMQMNQMRMQRNMNAAGAMVGVTAINQMRKWISTGADFGYTMQFVNSIAKEQGITYDQLADKAKRLGENTMFSAIEVADGMKFMAMAGQNTEQIFNNITAATNLAGSTMTDLGGKGGAADILTNVMKGFNIEDTLENSTRVADVLTTSATSANLSLFDLGEALKYSTSTAKDLNLTLEETAAMIMMAGDAGIQGSMAGTAVENMLRYVVKAAGDSPGSKRGQALASIGLGPEDLRDARGNLLPIIDLMQLVGTKLNAISDNSILKQNALSDIFGVRGKREASLLLRNVDKFEEFVQLLNNDSTGKSAQIMDSMMGSLQGNILQLTSAWDSFKIAFTEALAPVLYPLLKGITFLLKTLTKIMETPFGKFLTILAAGWIIVKTASMAYRAVVMTMRLLHMQMGSAMATTSAQTVAGYGRMTASANAYGAAAARANMMSMGGRGGVMGTGFAMGPQFRGPGGRFMSTANANTAMYGRVGGGIRNSKIGQGLGRMSAGKMFKGGGLGWGMAGMGVSMLGDYVGGTGGKALGVAGSTMEYGGMGAMVGSMFGPLGTAIGGIGGALYGLGSGIYDWVTSTDENTQATDDNTNSNQSLVAHQALAMQDPQSFWNKNLSMSKGNFGDITSTYGINPNLANISPFQNYNSGLVYQNTGVSDSGGEYRKGSGTEVNIFMDGEKMIQEKIDQGVLYNNIELGLY